MSEIPPKKNSDVRPSDSVLQSFKVIRPLLLHHDLANQCDDLDRQSDTQRKLAHALGVVSVLCGVLALLAIVVELAGRGRMELSREVSIGVESASIAAIVLGVLSKIIRGTWLNNAFLLARLRQWHFQGFLDGSIVSKVGSRHLFENTRLARYAKLQSITGSDPMIQFVEENPARLKLVPMSIDSRMEGIQEIVESYRQLRLEYLIAVYTKREMQNTDFDRLLEFIARFGVVLAVLCSATQVILLLVNRMSEQVRPFLLGASVGLPIVSVGARAVRDGMTTRFNSLRLRRKCNRLRFLLESFDSVAAEGSDSMAGATERRIQIMREIETLEVEDLRDFLRQARDATFLL
jgi:hypothetical protein